MNHHHSDRQNFIGDIIDVPLHNDCADGDINAHNDDSTFNSEITWDQEPTTAQQTPPHRRTSQGTTRCLHPFPWSTPDEGMELENDHPHHNIIEEQQAYCSGAIDSNTTSNLTEQQLRRSSSLVANDSALDGKCLSLSF